MRDLVDVVGALAALPDVAEVSMTTNGVLLADHADALVAAGLGRVNVSMDSLDPVRFDASRAGTTWAACCRGSPRWSATRGSGRSR